MLSHPRQTTIKLFKTTITYATGILIAVLCSSGAFATTVQFQTNMGDFEVALFDETAPASVKNFLDYVNSNAYKNNIFHRSIQDFVVQAGGYKIGPPTGEDKIFSIYPVTTKPAVKNEPKISNLLGTLAYAKLGNNANSATSQWFFNLDNNSANLDYQNGGFTVFGQVINNGMTIVNSIAALKTETLNDNFTDIPLIDFMANTKLEEDNFVTIYNIIVIDPDPKSAANLKPAMIDLKLAPQDTSSSGGGYLGLAFLMLLTMATIIRASTTRAVKTKL